MKKNALLMLLPREHGAYGQFLLPLLISLAVRPCSSASLLLAFAAASIFVAHEPLLILLGQRGGRMLQEHAASSRRLLGGLGLIAGMTGGAGLCLGGLGVAASALPSALLAGLVAWMAAKGLEKSLSGEIAATLALTSASVPVAVAEGLPLEVAGLVWVVWSLGFGTTTMAVRKISARRKEPQEPLFSILCVLTLLVLGLAGWRWGIGSWILPVVGSAWAVWLFRPHPRQLRRIGWATASASVASALLLLRSLRG